MKLKEFDILLDIKKNRKIEEFEVVQGDYDSNVLNISIVEDVKPYNLSGLDIEVAFAKPDGTTVIQDDAKIQGNKVICTLKTNTIAAPGRVNAEVRILEGGKLLTTARFAFFVRRAIVNDETVKSTNEFPIFQKIAKQILSKQIETETMWEYRMPGKEPVFSTPIFSTFSNDRKVVIYQSWDWFIYVQDVITGEVIWRYPFGAPNYGRPQAADVNGDGKVEIFGASHDGIIYCLDEEGQVIWKQYNLYDTEGSGEVTSASEWGIIDETKDWVEYSFMRENRDENPDLVIISGTGEGQVRKISSVETNAVWIQDAWEIIPDDTSTYEIRPMYESDKYFQHAGQLCKEDNGWYLYVTGFDNQCRKIDAVTGEIIWRFSAREHNEPFPIITDIDNDGVLECIFGSIDTYIYCLNAQDGALKWKSKMGNGVDCFASYGDVDNDGNIEYITNSRAGRTYILDGMDGSIKYQSTDMSVWATSEFNSRPTIFEYSPVEKAIVFGGLAGYVYCLNGKGDTIWRFYNGAIMRGSTNIADINYDGELEILVPDMMGTITILNKYGVEIGQINIKGGVEGTPLIGDLDGDGKTEMCFTSLDGYVKMIKFI